MIKASRISAHALTGHRDDREFLSGREASRLAGGLQLQQRYTAGSSVNMASGPRTSPEETAIPASPSERRIHRQEQEQNAHTNYTMFAGAYGHVQQEVQTIQGQIGIPNVGSNTAVTEKSYKQRGSELVPTHKSAQSKGLLYERSGILSSNNDGRLNMMEEAIRRLDAKYAASTSETKAELAAMRTMHQQHREVVNGLKKDINEKSSKIRALEEQLSKLVAESDSQLASLRAKLDQERKEKDELQLRLRDTEAKYTAAEARLCEQRDTNQKLMELLCGIMTPQSDPLHTAPTTGGIHPHPPALRPREDTHQQPAPLYASRHVTSIPSQWPSATGAGATPTAGQQLQRPMQAAPYSSSVGASTPDDQLDELLERQASLKTPHQPPPLDSNDHRSD